MHGQLASRRILFLLSFNWGNSQICCRNYHPACHFDSYWNHYRDTLPSNALPQVNSANWMAETLKILWDIPFFLPLCHVLYCKATDKFKPQLKYKISPGNTAHNSSPPKSPVNISKVLNTSYVLECTFGRKKHTNHLPKNQTTNIKNPQ